MSEQLRPVRRALVSVYDKTGLDPLGPSADRGRCRGRQHRVDGRGAAAAGVDVTPVSEVTELPGSVRRPGEDLHPPYTPALLADLSKPSHVAQLEELGYAPFELVIVNLYPFVEYRWLRVRARPRWSSRSISAARR